MRCVALLYRGKTSGQVHRTHRTFKYKSLSTITNVIFYCLVQRALLFMSAWLLHRTIKANSRKKNKKKIGMFLPNRPNVNEEEENEKCDERWIRRWSDTRLQSHISLAPKNKSNDHLIWYPMCESAVIWRKNERNMYDIDDDLFIYIEYRAKGKRTQKLDVKKAISICRPHIITACGCLLLFVAV